MILKIFLSWIFIIIQVYSDNCLTQSEVGIEVLPINEEVGHIYLKSKDGHTLYQEIEFVNNELILDKDRVKYIDLNFDAIPEILIDTTITAQLSYEVFSIQCHSIVEFYPKILSSFRLDKKNKTLIETTKSNDGYRPKWNTYILSRNIYCK